MVSRLRRALLRLAQALPHVAPCPWCYAPVPWRRGRTVEHPFPKGLGLPGLCDGSGMTLDEASLYRNHPDHEETL